MTLKRRTFLTLPAALASSSLMPGSLRAALAAQTPDTPDLSHWDSVRAQFALDPAYRHFASFFIASHPAPVRDALEGYRRALDANPFVFVERSMFEDDAHNLPMQVRAEAASYLGGKPEEVCLTGSTTEGLSLVYLGLPLKAGDEVLTTLHDHYSHHEAIRFATQRTGVSARRIALFRDPAQASVDEIVGNLRAATRPETKVVGVTWVHSSTGIRLPIRAISAMLQSLPQPPLLVVDGVHGLGSVDETISTLGADYFCAGTHKWISRRAARVWCGRGRTTGRGCDRWCPTSPRPKATSPGPKTANRRAPTTPRAWNRAASTQSSTSGRWPRPSPCISGWAGPASAHASRL